MKKISKLLALLIAITMCIGMLSACGGSGDSGNAGDSQPAGETGEGTGGGTADGTKDNENSEDQGGNSIVDASSMELKIGSNDPKCFGHFDTTCAFDANYNGYAMDLVFDFMLYKDAKTGEYTSNILSDWHWDDEACGAVITLKEGVLFSDGDQMTGEDIVYTLERMASSFMNGDMKTIINIDALSVSEDGLTVTVPFFKPYGPWKEYLAGNSSVHNKSWEDEHGGAEMDFSLPENVCGSGPYRVVEYVVDSYTVYEKRDDWWMEGQQPEGTASFGKITVTNYSDTTTMMVDYETGALDIAFGISNTDYDRIGADASLGAVGTNDTNFVSMLNLNTDSSPLSDKHLREVLAYGVDWKQICQLAYGSLGTPAQSSLPADSPAFVGGLVYEYDPEKAQQIVDENNLAGTELTWVATPDVTGTIAEAVQGMVSQYGIKINIEVQDMASAIMTWMAPGATMTQLDGSSFSNLGNDANQQYRSCFAEATFPNISKKDQKLNDLLNEGRWSTDEAGRIDTYKEVQQYIYDEIFVLPIAEWYSAFCYNTDVISSMEPLDLSMPQLRNIVAAAGN